MEVGSCIHQLLDLQALHPQLFFLFLQGLLVLLDHFVLGMKVLVKQLLLHLKQFFIFVGFTLKFLRHF